MCKIAIISGITDETTKMTWELMKKLSKEMTRNDDEGFGYAAIDGNGKLFGERWYDPKDAFHNRDSSMRFHNDLIKKYKGMLKGKEPIHNSFGEVHENSLRTVIIHARKATCERSIRNTHPFVIGDTALIHNGVIRNTTELENKVSTCDSECILNEYIKYKVSDDLKSIQKVADKLEGYYACGVISKTSKGQVIVDIFRDKAAKLEAYFVKELNTVIFATPGFSDSYGSVPSACKDSGLTITDRYEVSEAFALRMDAMTGEVLDGTAYDSTYKDKKKKGSGTGGNNAIQIWRNGENVRDKYSKMFDSHSSKSHHRTWSDQQKDDELERALCEGFGEGYEVYGDAAGKFPAGPKTQAEVKKEYEEDFICDGDGTWHRKGTGTDRL